MLCCIRHFVLLLCVVLCAFAVTSCVTRPEEEKILERDKALYNDGGALKQKKERRDKVAVVVSQGDYQKYKEVAKTLDSQLTDALSAFAFFQVVERSNLGALQSERLFGGEDLEEGVVVPADYLVTAHNA